MDKTGGWRRRAKIIGSWEHSYLTRVNVLPGPLHRLAELRCNQRREQMWSTGRTRRSHQHERRKAKWLLKDAIHRVKHHLKNANPHNANAVLSLTIAFTGSCEGIEFFASITKTLQGPDWSQRWGDNELPCQIRSIQWVLGYHMFKQACSLTPVPVCWSLTVKRELVQLNCLKWS